MFRSKAPLVLASLIALLSQGSTSANPCKDIATLGNAEWQDDVLSTNEEIFILEMEFANTLHRIGECADRISSERANTVSHAQSAANQQTNSVSKALAKPTDNDSENQVGDPRRNNSYSEQTDNDSYSEQAGNVTYADNLEIVLLEAIQNETDANRRKALIERYKQLFGSDPKF